MNEQRTQDPNTGDVAYRILRDVTADDSVKGDAWDEFYEARSTKDLEIRLQRVTLPESVKNALVTARKSLDPSAREHVVDAIKHLSKLDPELLATAEAHPNLLRFMLDAATKESEE